MKHIDTITDQSKQNIVIYLEDGRSFNLFLKFVDNQLGWFYSITSSSFNIFNRRVVTHPNMLRSLRNVLGFGIACITEELREPLFIDDFLLGKSNLYILEPEDVVVAEEVMARND